MGGSRRIPRNGGSMFMPSGRAKAAHRAAPFWSCSAGFPARQRSEAAAPHAERPEPRWAAAGRLRGAAGLSENGGEAQERLFEGDVLAAVQSLYDDQLRPYGRILRKRLSELSAAPRPYGSGGGKLEIDAAKLRAACEASSRLHVEPEEGGEWSALLNDRPEDFVDVYSEEDVYPEELWEAAAKYFERLGNGHGEDLPGGRYASAQALAARGLRFLVGMSLGQVCHITQLAITQRKLLGYFSGAIVPYDRSTSMVKSRCAQQQLPCTSTAGTDGVEGGGGGTSASGLPVATWQEARIYMREILETAIARGADQVPLSNVKRLFRSLYTTELSETALGHSKLSELLQDPRFEDICAVQLQDRGYAVVPRLGCMATAEEPGVMTPRREGGSPDGTPALVCRLEDCESGCSEKSEKDSASWDWSGASLSTCPTVEVHRTFIHAAMPPTTPLRRYCVRRASSVPASMGSSWKQPTADSTSGLADLLLSTEDHSAPGELELEQVEQADRIQFCPDEPLCLEDADSYDPFSSGAFPAPTPSPQTPGRHPALAQTGAAQQFFRAMQEEVKKVQTSWADIPVCTPSPQPQQHWGSANPAAMTLLLPSAAAPRVVRLAGLI